MVERACGDQVTIDLLKVWLGMGVGTVIVVAVRIAWDRWGSKSS